VWLPRLLLGTWENKILTLNCGNIVFCKMIICLAVLVTPLDFSPPSRMFIVESKKYCLRMLGMSFILRAVKCSDT